MRGRLAVAAAAGVLCAGQVFGQCDDQFDNVLCVSTIAPAQAAQFSATDRQVAGFWAGLSGDYFELIPPDNCLAGMCGFSGQSDGTFLVKAAGTSKGLYLYVEVQDNVWVDWSGGTSYGDDSVDLYFDKLDANTIWTCTDCLVGLYDSRLSYTTQQMQVFMGASAPPSTFRFAYYDPNQWAWVTVDMTYADARAVHGFEVEAVTVDATHKVQEWFLPWDTWGTEGLAPGTPLAGLRLGFAGGYNDMDGDNPNPDCLRWPLGGDPWTSDQNYWGDMLLASDMGTVEAHSTARAVRPAAMARAAAAPGGVPGAAYTLRGERMPSLSVAQAAGIVVQRQGTGAAVRRVGTGW
jgi:hypothetical protein